VADHGRLVVVWFQGSKYARDWRATDHSDAIDQWAREITVCPTHANPCDLPG